MLQPEATPRAKWLKGWIFDWAETLIFALVLALIIRAFFLQVFWIPSGSMIPTFDIKDRIVVNKVVYHFSAPQRFDVIVFRSVPAMGDQKKDLIKRLIGLPGEKLQLKKGTVFINDVPLTEKHSMNLDFCDFGPVMVPADSYFVLGDNRPASADSRYWGFLPTKNVIGPAFLQIWPLNKIRLISRG